MNKKTRPIFVRITMVILLLLIPVIFLYTYSNQTGIRVINSEINSNNENQLLFLKNEIETNIERLSFSPSVLARDSTIINLEKAILTEKYYDMIGLESQLQEKMYLQSFFSSWTNDITLYLPPVARKLTANQDAHYDSSLLKKAVYGQWIYHPESDNEASYFQFFFADPYYSGNITEQANAIFEVRFKTQNIERMLENYNAGKNRYPFMLFSTGKVIANASSGDTDISDLARRLQLKTKSEIGHATMNWKNKNIFVSYIYVPALDTYLVDYVPIEVILSPIIKSRNFFYVSLLLLLFLGFIASFILYRQVQIPISDLIKALKKIASGDYSFRIVKKYNNEFDYLMGRFNDMSAQIEHLIENVYEEQNRSRLATLKQLQAQINPHFLYNCLSFIAGCAKSGNIDTVMTMTYHLGDYYRYTTRLENQMPLLKDEIKLVENYLEIYRMRMERITYVLDIPNELMDEPVLRLMVQPIVENAIVHGLEPKPGLVSLLITGGRYQEELFLTVEDDGMGLSEEELIQLRISLERPMDETTGCGLWNVHQRLKQKFGPQAGVELSHSQGLSGLRVTLKWVSKVEI